MLREYKNSDYMVIVSHIKFRLELRRISDIFIYIIFQYIIMPFKATPVVN